MTVCDDEDYARWQLVGIPTPPSNPVGYFSSDAKQARRFQDKKEKKTFEGE